MLIEIFTDITDTIEVQESIDLDLGPVWVFVNGTIAYEDDLTIDDTVITLPESIETTDEVLVMYN